jgi:hypothetical protein
MVSGPGIFRTSFPQLMRTRAEPSRTLFEPSAPSNALAGLNPGHTRKTPRSNAASRRKPSVGLSDDGLGGQLEVIARPARQSLAIAPSRGNQLDLGSGVKRREHL